MRIVMQRDSQQQTVIENFRSTLLIVSVSDPLEDKLYLVGNGVFVSLQTLGYVVGARLISPTMFSVVETVGIPVYFFTQEIFLHQVALPYNLPLQITSLVVVFIASITLPLYETVNNKNPEEKTEKQ